MQLAERTPLVSQFRAIQLGRTIAQYRVASVGVGILIVFVVLAVVAPVLGLADPYSQSISDRLQPPSTTNYFGTDQYGRDLFSRVIFGTQSSLIVAFASVGLAAVVGIVLGLTSGYLGGYYDQLIMRFTDILMSFPSILLGIGMMAALGPNLFNLVIVLALVRIPTLARVIRADALAAKQHEFVDAARAIGASRTRIAALHVFPSTVPSIIVIAALSLGQAVILEAAFGFLGLGVQPPTPSWGNLLSSSRDFLRTAPYTVIIPGIFIALLALSFNLIGDGLRDYLDPRSNTRNQ